MAPWWLRASEDESYDDELGIDDGSIAAMTIEPEPTGDERAFAIGWEDEAAAEPAAEARREDEGEAEPAPARADAAPPAEPAKPKKRKRRRRRRKSKAKPQTAATESPDRAEEAPVAADQQVGQAADAAPAPAVPEAAEKKPEAAEPTQEEIVFDFGPTERSAAASDERKIALFCDLENIALGVRNSETKKFDINLVLERLLEKGKIIVKKAYADWERYSNYKRAFHDAAIELIDIPQKHFSGKNSADIKMVVDAMDLCYSKEHLDTFVILSGDSDFSPLVSKLKENNKYVIGVGVKNSTSHHLIDNCDEFIYYEDVWRDLQRTPRLDHLSPKDAEVFGLLIESILALIRENKTILWGSMIKQTMQRKRPSFSEGYYGHGSFSELLEDARKKDIIRLKRDQRSGNYAVVGFGQQS